MVCKTGTVVAKIQHLSDISISDAILFITDDLTERSTVDSRVNTYQMDKMLYERTIIVK